MTSRIGLIGIPAIARQLASMQVFESPLATRDKPVREHVEKRWMHGRAYHRRIAKKWRKRYGVRAVPAMYQVGSVLFVHPTLYASIRVRIGKNTERRVSISDLVGGEV